MKNYYIILISILFIPLSSCKQTMIISGTYSDKNSHVFIFSKDSIFQYEYQDYCYSKSSGIWNKKGDFLYLNSFIQIERIPLECVKIKNNTDSDIIVRIEVNSQGKPQTDYICWPFINGKPCLFDPERGSYSFKSEIPINNICFRIRKSPFIIRGTGSKMCYDDIETETIYPHLSVGENLDVTVNIVDSLFGYTVFKDEKIELKNGKIIFKNREKKNKLYLKK